VEPEYFAQSPESATGSALASLVASANDKGFAKIQRYLAAAERAWRRALKDLLQTQSARRRQERQQEISWNLIGAEESMKQTFGSVCYGAGR